MGSISGMTRSVLTYAGAIALGAFLLQWLEYQYTVRLFSTSIYIVIIGVLFAALGVWSGLRLASREAPEPFRPNEKAMDYLGISPREREVLELLALGHSNREIATTLYVSPNTVKSHLARLYEKLEVSRRTQAVQKARSMQMIP